jgi:hypothetical protein
MCEPVSAWRALRRAASRTGPWGSNSASSRRRLASSVRRSSRDWICLNRRRCCMTLPRVLTVGFEFTIPNMPTAGRRFQSEHDKQRLRNGVHAVHVRRIAIHSATVNPVPLMGTTIYVAPKPHRHSIADTGAGPYFTHFFNPAGRFIERCSGPFHWGAPVFRRKNTPFRKWDW